WRILGRALGVLEIELLVLVNNLDVLALDLCQYVPDPAPALVKVIEGLAQRRELREHYADVVPGDELDLVDGDEVRRIEPRPSASTRRCSAASAGAWQPTRPGSVAGCPNRSRGSWGRRSVAGIPSGGTKRAGPRSENRAAPGARREYRPGAAARWSLWSADPG